MSDADKLADALSETTRERIPLRGEFVQTDWRRFAFGWEIEGTRSARDPISKYQKGFHILLGPVEVSVRYTPAHEVVLPRGWTRQQAESGAYEASAKAMPAKAVPSYASAGAVGSQRGILNSALVENLKR